MLNRVVLVGRLGADPELRYTPSGQAVCSFRIAVDRQKTKAQREQNQPATTDWIPIVVWGQQGVNCSQYLNKGKLVAIDGRLQFRSWEDQQTGQKRTAADVVADNVQFLSPRDGGGSGGGSFGGGDFSGGGSNLGSEISFPDDDDLPF